MTKAYLSMLVLASTIVSFSCSNGAKKQSDEDSMTSSEVNSKSSTDTDTNADTDTHTDDTEPLDSDTVDSETVDGGTDDSEAADSGTEEPKSSDSDFIDTATGPPIDIAVILNPYDAVDWETWGQYKANFHAHTTNSDGSNPPEVVIEQYHSKSYDVLAITDHDYTTWPWTDYGMDPQLLEMVAVKGNEYSQSHHVNAFYNFTETVLDMATGVPHIHEQEGLSQINHPGSYAYSNETYLNYYEQYTSCIWLEVFNTGDRYPDDRARWDQINEMLFFEQGRLVWGASNDDMHTTDELYRNFQFMLAPELTETAIRDAQTSGAFYFAYEPEGSGDAKVPRIISIEIDNEAKNITVNATAYDAIHWIGPGTEGVAEGTVFNFSDYATRSKIKYIEDLILGYAKRPFVRFVLEGPYGNSYSQPFGFESTPLDADTNGTLRFPILTKWAYEKKKRDVDGLTAEYCLKY